MVNVLLVGVGGFLGSIARYGLGGLMHRLFGAGFPYSTLAANLIGCFLIGMVGYLIEFQSMISPQLRLFLTIGLLGGFTTFSSFGYETMGLFRAGQFGLGLINIGGNLIVGLAAVWLGRVTLSLIS